MLTPGTKTWLLWRTPRLWRQLVTIAVALAGAVLTLMSFTTFPLRGVLIVLLVALALSEAIFVWSDERNRTPLILKDPSDLVEDNVAWFTEQGHVVIYTRDLSWVLTDELRPLVEKKAASRSLTIIASERTDWILGAQRMGATVVTNSAIPRVRFAALRYGADDCRILITRQNNGKIEVREYTKADFPVHQLCLDLIAKSLPERVAKHP